jgi:hypothetical protein
MLLLLMLHRVLNKIRINFWHWNDLWILFQHVRRKLILVQDGYRVGSELVGTTINFANDIFRKMFRADSGMFVWAPFRILEVISNGEHPLLALVRVPREGVRVGYAAASRNKAAFLLVD